MHDAKGARRILARDYWERHRTAMHRGTHLIPHETHWNWKIGHAEFGQPLLQKRSLTDCLMGKQQFALRSRSTSPISSASAKSGFSIYGNFTACMGKIHYRATKGLRQQKRIVPVNGMKLDDAVELLFTVPFSIPDKPMMVYISSEDELCFRGSQENYEIAVATLNESSMNSNDATSRFRFY